MHQQISVNVLTNGTLAIAADVLNRVFKGNTVTDCDSTRRVNCLCRLHCLVLILNSKQSYHISIVTVLLHIVTTNSPKKDGLTVQNIGKTKSL